MPLPMFFSLRRFLALLMLCAPFGAQAEVAGQKDPRFAAAHQLWLGADEAQSLTSLAVLAAEGNVAAQLLLGLIDVSPGLQGDWLMAQDRNTRLSLLRPPGGVSGGNWLREAAKTDPVAQAWLHLWAPEATPEVVLEFARLGEPRAARVAALALAARQKRGFGPLADDPAYPEPLRGLAILEWQATDPARAAASLAALDAGDPQRGLFGPAPVGQPLADWLKTHPEGSPLLALCAALCPTEPPQTCQTEAFAAMGGYHSLMRMGPPVAALSDQPGFDASPMGQAITLRRIQQFQVGFGRKAPPDLQSACLRDALMK